MTITLGIETSCDDTSVAVVKDGFTVLSSLVSSQDDIHRDYGGIVPEMASRRHTELLTPLTNKALSDAGVTIKDIDSIAVTSEPGLVGSLLTGLSFAKALAYGNNITFVGVNHIIAHTTGPFLVDKDFSPEPPNFPLISLVISGGHTLLIYFKSFLDYEVLGSTRDDALGEAFDKVAKMLGLGYPGGVLIDKLSKDGNKKAYHFKRVLLDKESLDFSFSGIKTSVLNETKKVEDPTNEIFRKDIAASFSACVADIVETKALRALDTHGAATLTIAGGVAANSTIRERLTTTLKKEGYNFTAAPLKYCSDNGAMIACLGHHMIEAGHKDDLTLNAQARSNFSKA